MECIIIFLINKSGKKIYIYRLGAAGYSDFTLHKDEERKQRSIARHKYKMKIGQNQELTQQGGGPSGIYGIYQLKTSL